MSLRSEANLFLNISEECGIAPILYGHMSPFSKAWFVCLPFYDIRFWDEIKNWFVFDDISALLRVFDEVYAFFFWIYYRKNGDKEVLYE